MTVFALRLIACVAMLLDHVAAVFLIGSPFYVPFRIVGRLAFPIFAFLAVQGYFHTKSFSRYMFRLVVVAVLSQIPYMVAFPDAFRLNVIFQLIAGLWFLWLFDHKTSPLRYLSSLVAIGMLSLASEYSLLGLFLMVALYAGAKRLSVALMALCSINLFGTGALAALLFRRYNGQCGRKLPRLVVYGFYPIHLFLLAFLSV